MKTVLSVRDFAILYELAKNQKRGWERNANRYSNFFKEETEKEVKLKIAEQVKQMEESLEYQDLKRIVEKLGTLNIEVETPDIEIEKII